MRSLKTFFLTPAVICVFCCWHAAEVVTPVTQTQLPYVSIEWEKVIAISKTSLSIQVCPEPPLRRGASTHGNIFKSLKGMHINYARLQPWYCYPRLGVAELEPPNSTKTFWDFKLIDPIVEDFMKSAEGRPVMLNFSTLPQWMYVTKQKVKYPEDPNKIDWKYNEGNKLRDTSLKEVVDYFHRIACWYMKGGFTDELGKYHRSGHFYKIAYWEVLNEIESEHNLTPKQITDIYDAVVSDLSKLDSTMKFSSLALASPAKGLAYFDYFLNPENHKKGIPLDMVSYHFYASTGHKWLKGDALQSQKNSYYKQADNFYETVLRIDSIRKRLSPSTKTYINELGSFTAGDLENSTSVNIPPFYWTLSGSMFAYLYPRLVKTGIDVIAVAELIDYPGQFAGASILDWNTGMPNARYQVVKLLADNFSVGDRLVQSNSDSEFVMVQGFIASGGSKKILLVNKSDREVKISLPDVQGGYMASINEGTGGRPASTKRLKSNNITLNAHAVAVIKLMPR